MIISVGELNKNKNHKVIIRAVAELPQNVKYVIVGKGVLEERLKQLAVNLGVENRVILTGFRTDVRDFLWMSDCFAFPSLREGLGLAALEGMAAGLPVIASDIGGIRDYVIDGETGYKSKSNDAEGYKKAIRTVMKKSNYDMITAVRECAAQHSKSLVNLIMEDVYSLSKT